MRFTFSETATNSFARFSRSGSVTGVVNDPSGAAVAGATVTLRHNETGITHTDTSNENGEYSFPSVTPGVYTLTFEASGFKKSVAPDITVEVGNPARASMTLEVGAVSEVVTVTAGRAGIRTSSINGPRESSANVTENGVNATGEIRITTGTTSSDAGARRRAGARHDARRLQRLQRRGLSDASKARPPARSQKKKGGSRQPW